VGTVQQLNSKPVFSIHLDTIVKPGGKEIVEEACAFINSLAGHYKINILSHLHQELTQLLLEKHGIHYDSITMMDAEVSKGMIFTDKAVCYRGDFARAAEEIVHFRKWDEPVNDPGILVRFKFSPEKGFTYMKITGHANLYPGRDPLCGGVSALGFALVGTLSNVEGVEFIKREFEDNIEVKIIPIQDSGKRHAANIVFETILIGLRQLALGYPKHITIEKL